MNAIRTLLAKLISGGLLLALLFGGLLATTGTASAQPTGSGGVGVSHQKTTTQSKTTRSRKKSDKAAGKGSKATSRKTTSRSLRVERKESPFQRQIRPTKKQRNEGRSANSRPSTIPCEYIAVAGTYRYASCSG